MLQNPVYNALLTGDSHLSLGNENVKYFDPAVSPFVGFKDGNSKSFDDLYDMLPTDRKILFASPLPINQPNGWQLQHEIKGLQLRIRKRQCY